MHEAVKNELLRLSDAYANAIAGAVLYEYKAALFPNTLAVRDHQEKAREYTNRAANVKLDIMRLLNEA